MADSKTVQQRVTIATTMATAIAVAIYALYIIGIGIMAEQAYIFSAILQGVIILLGAILVLGGLLRYKLYIAWIGLALLAASSAIFVFGAGTLLLPMVGLLFILLLLTTLSHKRNQNQE